MVAMKRMNRKKVRSILKMPLGPSTVSLINQLIGMVSVNTKTIIPGRRMLHRLRAGVPGAQVKPGPLVAARGAVRGALRFAGADEWAADTGSHVAVNREFLLHLRRRDPAPG